MSKILLAFSSLFGANAQLAEVTESVLTGFGAEVRVRHVPELVFAGIMRPEVKSYEAATGEDLAWAEGIILGSPSHTGLLSASMKAFIDLNHEAAVAGDYLNKTFVAMATSGFMHAGQEGVVANLNSVAAAWGCLVVPPSTANDTINRMNGNPYGLSFVLEHGKIPDPEATKQVLETYFKRFVAVTSATAQLRPIPSVAAHLAETQKQAAGSPPTIAGVFG